MKWLSFLKKKTTFCRRSTDAKPGDVSDKVQNAAKKKADLTNDTVIEMADNLTKLLVNLKEQK